MNLRYLLLAIALAIVFLIAAATVPEAALAMILVLVMAAFAIFIIRRFADDKDFVAKVFLVALALRLGFGLMVHFLDLRDFFGGDANTYDFRGSNILGVWLGQIPPNSNDAQLAMRISGAGWGMNYLVAALYFVFGKNILLAQSFCAVFGAATAPMVYFCSQRIFHNARVAKISAIAIAIFPSFIIWSAQLMKDGLIIFLLVLVITMVLELHQRFNYAAVVALVLAMFGIMSLRFYIFYMVAIAVVGSFLIGVSNSIPSIVRRSAVLVALGLGLTYFGVIRTATVDIERFGNLEAVQRSRLDLARSAKSGFGATEDVSTAEGAISTLPVGLAYLMLAPFPWQMANLRQVITLPEVLAWWAMIPLMISGIWYSIKNKLRTAFPVLLFSLMLTIAYSVFQGNVGTAYRQRTQIQVFLFMFIAVGWVLFKEKRENAELVRRKKREMFEASLKGRLT